VNPVANKKEPVLDFEAALQRLTVIAEAIENGKLPLENALAQYEEGVALVRTCQHTLRTAEQRLEAFTNPEKPE